VAKYRKECSVGCTAVLCREEPSMTCLATPAGPQCQ
jgi:hypothetical protein